VFSGENSSVLLYKTGDGTLTLSTDSPGNVTVGSGTLVLNSPTSGNVTLGADGSQPTQTAMLLASGRLSTLKITSTVLSAPILDIGGSVPASLTTDSFLRKDSIIGPLTVRFDLGVSAQDLWTITNPTKVFAGEGTIYLFDFRQLGAIAPGTEFTLINVTEVDSPLTPAMIDFAPSAIAAGWSGTFSVDADSVNVTIATTPEPGSAALIVFGGVLFGCRFRLRSRRQGC